jgi:hypothetical protein
MPIRSPRGRSAAYRGLWQWPLRSPARLALTAVAVPVVVVAATVGVGMTSRPPPAAPASATPTPTPVLAPGGASAADPTALPPVAELRPTTLPVSAAPAAALQVASTWARAWVRPPDGTSTNKWLDGLRATTTDEYLGVLAGVDPANIPATRVTGAPKAVAVSPRSLQVQVPTDALMLLITVVDTGTGWRVAGYDRA